MGWAKHYIQKLLAGETVEFRPKGNSMQPHISSGDLIRVEPHSCERCKKGDIVLCHVNGNDYVHLVSAVASNGSVQISNSNARGRVNGYTRRIFGKVSVINGKVVST